MPLFSIAVVVIIRERDEVETHGNSQVPRGRGWERRGGVDDRVGSQNRAYVAYRVVKEEQ